jgi:hypothetical protein
VHDAHAALADPVLYDDGRLAAFHPQRLAWLYQRVHDAYPPWFPVGLVPVGWPWVTPPGVVLVSFAVVAEPSAEGCPGRLAGPVGVPLDSRGVDVPPATDREGVARGAGCPVGWSAGDRWPEPDDCDMTTAAAIAAAAAAAAIPAVTARRRENRAGAGPAPGKSVAGKPARRESAPR